MAGPWFVNPDSGLTTNTGLSDASPWKFIPGQSGWTTQTGYAALVDGDVINVRNGTSTTVKITAPKNDLTYRGYGIASNVLTLRLPSPWNPIFARTLRVAREWGVHEGMWTIDATAIDSFGSAIATSVRTGCVFEDVNIIGGQLNNRPAVAFASSLDNVAGVTMRRFAIAGSDGVGISASTKDVLLEYGRIEYTKGDNIVILGSAANSARLGSVDTLRYLELREPNRNIEGGEVTGLLGDCFHLTPNAGAFNGTLVAHDIFMDKSSGIKQALVVHQTAAAASITMNKFHVTGGGNVTFLIGHIKNLVEITNIAFVGNYNLDTEEGSLPLIRFSSMDSTPPAYGMDTGSVLRIKNITVNGFGAGFYRCAQNEVAQSFDGTIEIDGVTAAGENTSPFSSAATFSFESSGNLNAYGPNFQLRIRNCASLITGAPHIRFPAIAANNSAWQVQTNHFDAGTYVIGATTYTDLAAFATAHNAAVGNTEGDPVVAPSYRPLLNSPLVGAGTYLGVLAYDITGLQRPNPPSIGAYESFQYSFRSYYSPPRLAIQNI